MYHKAEIRDGNSHLACVFAIAIIDGVEEIMLNSRGKGEFLGTVKSKSCWVDARRSDVPAQGASGVAHGHAARRSFVIGLRIQNGIIHALSLKEQRDAEEEYCG